MNRQLRRQEKRQKSNGNNLSMQPSQTLTLPSLQELTNLDDISMENMMNVSPELKDLLQSQMTQEQPQKQKRQYKKKSDLTSDISGLDELGVKEDTAPKRPKLSAKQKKVNDGLINLIGTMGTGLCTAGTVAKKPVITMDGIAVLNCAPAIADNLIEVGKQFPNVMTTLERITEGSAVIGLIAALGGLATAISINHGWIKPDAISGLFDYSKTEMDARGTPND